MNSFEIAAIAVAIGVPAFLWWERYTDRRDMRRSATDVYGPRALCWLGAHVWRPISNFPDEEIRAKRYARVTRTPMCQLVCERCRLLKRSSQWPPHNLPSQPPQ